MTDAELNRRVAELLGLKIRDVMSSGELSLAEWDEREYPRGIVSFVHRWGDAMQAAEKLGLFDNGEHGLTKMFSGWTVYTEETNFAVAQDKSGPRCVALAIVRVFGGDA